MPTPILTMRPAIALVVALFLLVAVRQSGAAQAESADYEITFTATWSAATHPHPDGTESFPSSSSEKKLWPPSASRPPSSATKTR